MKCSEYRGRFAPSPTGPLHFGSLVAAVGSYLEAKKHHGTWLIRIEDLDTPRCSPAATEDILRTLAAFGMLSDEPVLYQSQRTQAYEAAFQRLKDLQAIYPCTCTRKEIADSALHGIEGPVYPGTCRNGIADGREARAWRIKTAHTPIRFDDALQGPIAQNLETDVGDFVVKRADGLFAYQLAVVVDDAEQAITHVVRGADLLASTPRQIYLQQCLGLPIPHYMHLPVIVNSDGEKLSKQTLAAPVSIADPIQTLLQLFDYIGLYELRQQQPNNLTSLWQQAITQWDSHKLQGIKTLSLRCDDDE